MRSSALKKSTDVALETRKKRLIISLFTPLPEAKVSELKELLSMASKTKSVKHDPSLDKALRRTLGSIDKYNQMKADHERLGKKCAEVKTTLQKDIYKNILAYSNKAAE